MVDNLWPFWLRFSFGRWVAGSFRGSFSRICLRDAFNQRFAKKTVVCFGPEMVNFPEVETENLGFVAQALLRMITSPNSGSLKVIGYFVLRLRSDSPVRTFLHWVWKVCLPEMTSGRSSSEGASIFLYCSARADLASSSFLYL